MDLLATEAEAMAKISVRAAIPGAGFGLPRLIEGVYFALQCCFPGSQKLTTATEANTATLC